MKKENPESFFALRTAAVRESGHVELSIVMPCLNEAETLETCIRKAFGYLHQHGVEGEVVIGDNGSTDGSREIAAKHGARVVDVPLRGYGAAIYYATLQARGNYIIVGDADDSYDFTALQPFLEKLRGRIPVGNGQPLSWRHPARSHAVEKSLFWKPGSQPDRAMPFLRLSGWRFSLWPARLFP